MRAPFVVVLAVTALAAGGCSKTDTAQARGREVSAKPVKVEAGARGNGQARRWSWSGTLAAVDQVTISSEADGQGQPDPRGSRRPRDGAGRR